MTRGLPGTLGAHVVRACRGELLTDEVWQALTEAALVDMLASQAARRHERQVAAADAQVAALFVALAPLRADARDHERMPDSSIPIANIRPPMRAGLPKRLIVARFELHP